MNRFEVWVMRTLIRKAVSQGYRHPNRIKGLYMLIADAVRNEFYEDNQYTRNFFMKELFEEAIIPRYPLTTLEEIKEQLA